MYFKLSGVLYKLGFHHAKSHHQLPIRFLAPSGITTCVIYHLGKDGEGKPRWLPRFAGSVLHPGQYNYEWGRKQALKAALEDSGWHKDLRTVAWGAYHLRPRMCENGFTTSATISRDTVA